jgi:hypothetical protein
MLTSSVLLGRTAEATAETTAWWTSTHTTTTTTTHVTSGTATTATSASRTTTTAATESTSLAGNVVKECRDFLMSLLQEVDEVTDNATIATIEERSGEPSVASTTSTANTMNIVVNVGWEVIVDNVGDIRDVKTTSSNCGGNEDRATTVAEHLQGTLTLTLSAVTVDCGCREALIEQELGERVRHTLRLNKDESETSSMSVKNVEKDRAFVVILDVLDLLGDVLRSGTNTADRQEDIVFQEVTSEHLDVTREGGRKHESLTTLNTGHVFTFDNTADLRLETHVKHTISFVKNEVLDHGQ